MLKVYAHTAEMFKTLIRGPCFFSYSFNAKSVVAIFPAGLNGFDDCIKISRGILDKPGYDKG